MTPKYIVIHTAAFQGRNCDADMIKDWHRKRGWRDIGYHFVILNDRHEHKTDGCIESGRSEDSSGAHARGLNGISLGICCIGHGDKENLTPSQYESLYLLVNKLRDKYRIPIENVIGHRELNTLIEKDLLSDRYRTSKSCPGSMIDMDFIRQQLRAPSTTGHQATELGEASNDLKNALATLEQYQHLFPNAQDELKTFVTHPELIELISSTD